MAKCTLCGKWAGPFENLHLRCEEARLIAENPSLPQPAPLAKQRTQPIINESMIAGGVFLGLCLFSLLVIVLGALFAFARLLLS